jgi:hypothetical protein
MNNKKQYKYLVVSGCSQTHGQGCKINKIWAKLLADRLGLELINLASAGSGWYHVEASVSSFINNNRDILNECFFILQKSALERRVNYEELPMCRTDVWEKWNIKYLSPIAVNCVGYNNWEKFAMSEFKPQWWDTDRNPNNPQSLSMWGEIHDANTNLIYFPEHKHFPNSRNFWKLGENNDINPPYISEQFEELMLHWATRISSFHLFLKSNNINHLIVDGYSPFLSYRLDFANYYDTEDEFEMVKKFWSTQTDDPDDEMVYDFKNIKSGWIFDSIDCNYKIDDVVLWSLYQFKECTEWNVDGGHAGPNGMRLIETVIYKNLVKKGWF